MATREHIQAQMSLVIERSAYFKGDTVNALVLANNIYLEAMLAGIAEPRIKPLNWDSPTSRSRWCWSANTNIGTYYIETNNGKHFAYHHATGWYGPSRDHLHEAQQDANEYHIELIRKNLE